MASGGTRSGAGRPAGQPKTGGRIKGTPNKDRDLIFKTIRLEVKKAVGKKDYDPLVELAILAMTPGALSDIKDAIKCHQIIAEYVHSKRRSIDMDAKVTTSHEEWVRHMQEAIHSTSDTEEDAADID